MNATEKQIAFINSLMTTLKRHDWNAEYLYWLNLVDFSHLDSKQATRIIDILKSYNRAESLFDAVLDNAEKAALFGEKAAAVVAFANAGLDKGIEFEDITTVFMAYESEQRAVNAPEGATLTAERCQEEIDICAKFVKSFQANDQLSKLLNPEKRLSDLRTWKADMKDWERAKSIAEIYGRYFPVHQSHFQTA